MTSTDPEKTLEITKETENYMRLNRLLMAGGRRVLQILFDGFLPPFKLPSELKRVKSQLQRKLRPEQLKILYQDGGKHGKSAEFDITLLSQLFAFFRWLPTPSNGWKVLPNDNDDTLEAHFLRIKLFRNKYCGHCVGAALDNATFNDVWDKVSHSLVRIVSHVKKDDEEKWKQAIANSKTGSLTVEERRCLEEWVVKTKQLFKGKLLFQRSVCFLIEVVAFKCCRIPTLSQKMSRK